MPKPNGFMQFTFEWKEKHGRNMNIAQATSAAGEVWKKMSLAEREQYKQRAQKGPTQNGKKREKLTCVGTSVQAVEKQRIEKEKLAALMTENIKKTVQLAVNKKTLKSEKFYFVVINHFIRLFHTDIYIPAEIAVIEFSLESGVTRNYHSLVNPRTEFYGNVYEAQQHSKTTHMLPLPPNALGEDNLTEIYAQIRSFVYDEAKGEYPPLYTIGKNINAISSALNYLIGREPDEISEIEIYSINQLFYHMKRATSDIGGTDPPKNHYITDDILQKDPFEYAVNIACSYHEEIDRGNYCALSQAIRFAFTFSDYMCEDLSLIMIPGRHMPMTTNIAAIGNNDTSGRFNNNRNWDDKSVISSLSALSIKSSYDTCEGSDCTNIVVPHYSRASRNHNDIISSMSDSTCNPYKRNEISQPPEDCYFSVDYADDDDDDVRSTATYQSRASTARSRGRGIIVWDDIKLAK